MEDKLDIDRSLKQQIGIRLKTQIKKDKKRYDRKRDKDEYKKSNSDGASD